MRGEEGAIELYTVVDHRTSSVLRLFFLFMFIAALDKRKPFAVEHETDLERDQLRGKEGSEQCCESLERRGTYDNDDPFEPVARLRVQKFHQSRLERESVIDSIVEGAADTTTVSAACGSQYFWEQSRSRQACLEFKRAAYGAVQT